MPLSNNAPSPVKQLKLKQLKVYSRARGLFTSPSWAFVMWRRTVDAGTVNYQLLRLNWVRITSNEVHPTHVSSVVIQAAYILHRM